MMKDFLKGRWFLLALLVVLAGLCFSGCASTESDNASARPWNAPQSWETGGLPSTLNQGH